MLELQIFLSNILVPCLLLSATIAGWAYLFADRPNRSNPVRSNPVRTNPLPTNPVEENSADRAAAEPVGHAEHRAAGLVLLAAIAALWMAFGLRVGWTFWPEDSWTRLPHLFALAGFGCWCSCLTANKPLPLKAVGWILCAVCIGIAADLMIPTGESWLFLLPKKSLWWSLMWAGPLLSQWSGQRMERRTVACLGLAWILCIAACAFLTSSFLRITEPLFAISSILGCAGLGTLLSKRTNYLACLTGPSTFAVAAIVANAQFNSYAGLPDSLSWLAMSSLPLAALLTWAVGRRADPPHLLCKPAIFMALIACLSLAAAIAARTYTLTGPMNLGE